MQAVILAAGDGGRLSPITLFQPKPLVKVGRKPMLDYTVEALEKVEVRDIIIVAGYKAWQISDYVARKAPYKAKITLAYNPEYEKGNAISLLVSYELIQDYPFILAMADHLLSPELIVRALQQSYPGGNFLAVDFNPEPRIVEEATKVLVDREGNVKAIGKNLEYFNGVDTGLFILTPEIFTAVNRVLAEKGDCELSDALNYLINHGSGLKACNVSGCFWMDVDTLEDLNWAEIKLSGEAENARRVYISTFKPEILKTFSSSSCPNTYYSQFRKLFKLSRRTWSGGRFLERPKCFGWDLSSGGFSDRWS